MDQRRCGVLKTLRFAALRSALIVSLAGLTGILIPSSVSAQEQPSPVADTVKRVVFDPTTYAPAVIAYDATMRDWNTSQPFFRNGYMERNERFTLTGRPNDIPVSYTVGQNRILTDALLNLQMSIVNNVADQVFERVLIDRFPQHRKLVRTLGWIERTAFASSMAYMLSSQHYRQAALNQARAQQMGIR
jgi:hypothetical protein